MTIDERIQEFKEFLSCRIDLFSYFQKYPEKNWFDEEFTFENWLRGKNGISTNGGSIDIKTRRYRSAAISINQKGMYSFGKLIPLENQKSILEMHEYSIYRFKKYNFKQRIFVDNVEI